MAAGEAEPRIRIAVFIEEEGMHIPPADGAREDRVTDFVGMRRFRHLLHLGAGGAIPAGAEMSSSRSR